VSTWVAALAASAGAWVGAPSALAAPPERDAIDARAAWFLHIDLAAIRHSRTGPALLGAPEAPLPLLLRRVRSDFGLDPAGDIDGITCYAIPGDGRTITLLDISARGESISKHLDAAPLTDYRVGVSEGVMHWSWVDQGRVTYAAVRPGPTPDRRRMVLAGDLGDLMQACSVLSGRAVALSSVAGPSPLRREVAPGTLVFAAAARHPDPAPVAEAPAGYSGRALLFRASAEMTLEVMERDGRHPEDPPRWEGRLWLRAVDSSLASDCEAIVRGMIGMVGVAARDKPSLAGLGRLLRDAVVERRDDQLEVTLKPSAEAVVQCLSELTGRPPALAGQPTDSADGR
jgi:hypothetical protein